MVEAAAEAAAAVAALSLHVASGLLLLEPY